MTSLFQGPKSALSWVRCRLDRLLHALVLGQGPDDRGPKLLARLSYWSVLAQEMGPSCCFFLQLITRLQ